MARARTRRLRSRLLEPAHALPALLTVGAVLLLLAQPGPPRAADDVCAIFTTRPGWRTHTEAVEERWGVPLPLQMALVHQESGFRASARPPRRRFLRFFPGRRPTSAYGYAQALDATWAEFQRENDRPDAVRHDFGDAVTFVGWYVAELNRLTGIARDDARNVYLAYHEGPGGFGRGSHLEKAWLLDVADRVAARARRYDEQYRACAPTLARRTLIYRSSLLGVLSIVIGAWIWVTRRPPSRRKRQRQPKRPR